MKTGIELIADERRRQIEIEGFTAEHDDQHTWGDLIDAAISYSYHADSLRYSITNVTFQDLRKGFPPNAWPWSKDWWKPSNDPIRDLTKAGALIAAEIDRLQRLKERNKK